MQRDQRFLAGKASLVHGYESGNIAQNTPMSGHYTYGPPPAPTVGVAVAGTDQEVPSALNRFEFQPYENCPRNFIIFDQTDKRSRVMFHPALAHNFSIHATQGHDEREGFERNDDNDDDLSSLFKENTADIDALLSSDEDEEDDDVVSTGRSPGIWGGDSPDSSSSLQGIKSHKKTSAFEDSFSGSSGRTSKRVRERTMEMVTALRGIIPGGESMDTPTILDEAVRYLKSLKMEVEQLGI